MGNNELYTLIIFAPSSLRSILSRSLVVLVRRSRLKAYRDDEYFFANEVSRVYIRYHSSCRYSCILYKSCHPQDLYIGDLWR